ncbi:MAG TPA: magnesium transporter CorA family protein [Candidatus Deferrimicrobium sp.]|nr:magnesium transporter CorA family protein [Candidatus Deferrimicrobium sp.]
MAHIWSTNVLRVAHDLTEIGAALDDADALLWVDVEDASAETLTELAAMFGLHHLVAEDIIERNQRAKIVHWDDSLHLVMFALHHDGDLTSSEVDIVLGPRFLITSHPPEWRPMAALDSNGRSVAALLAQGTDLLLYALVDQLVDGCFPVIDLISDQIDELEVDVVSGKGSAVVERLFRVRRSLLEVRHLVSPEREILNQLSNGESPLISETHRLYFRDVYDLTVRITDELDTHRELASGVLDAYLSSINNSLSEVMKRLTAITAVLAGVGAAAGIFGMSEAASALGLPGHMGFWLVTGVVLIIGLAVYLYFRRIDWI